MVDDCESPFVKLDPFDNAMAHINKGPLPKGGSYLVCDTARRGLPGCKSRLIRYDEFEDLVLTHCRNLNPADLLPGREEQESALKVLQGRAFTLQGEIKEVTSQVDNLADSIATTDNPAVRRRLEASLAEALTKQEKLQAEKQQIEQEITHHNRNNEDTQDRLDSMREMLEFLRDGSAEEVIEVRRRLREVLRGLIDRIDVRPVGRKPMTAERVKELIAAIIDVKPELAGTEELERQEADLSDQIESRDLRSYVIHFKGGSIRRLTPATSHKISLDFDKESGEMREYFSGVDGKKIEIKI